jgi:hypothetical protein
VADQFERSFTLKLIFAGQVCICEKPETATKRAVAQIQYFIHVFIGITNISCYLLLYEI